MDLKFKHISIIGTHTNPLVSQTICHLIDLLKDHVKITLEYKTAQYINCDNIDTIKLDDIAKKCDLAIVVGGDGNFLNAARNLALYGEIPLIGINRGKLGFLTDIKPDDINTRLIKMLKGEYHKESRFMLSANIHSNDSLSGQTSALNEIIISAGRRSKLFELNVKIDNCYAFSQRSDGMIIATPTGSTAHALSAGGPIMAPSLNAFVIVPLFSHSLNSRPLVINNESEICLTINEYNNPRPILSFDGHSNYTLRPQDQVFIKKHKKHITILHPLDYDYYESLRTKLHWSKLLFE